MNPGLQWHKSDGVETASENGFKYTITYEREGDFTLHCDWCEDPVEQESFTDTAMDSAPLKTIAESHAQRVALSVSKAVEEKLSIDVEKCIQEIKDCPAHRSGHLDLADMREIILKHLKRATPSIGGKE